MHEANPLTLRLTLQTCGHRRLFQPFFFGDALIFFQGPSKTVQLNAPEHFCAPLQKNGTQGLPKDGPVLDTVRASFWASEPHKAENCFIYIPFQPNFWQLFVRKHKRCCLPWLSISPSERTRPTARRTKLPVNNRSAVSLRAHLV
jgi:hypothetical protein